MSQKLSIYLIKQEKEFEKFEDIIKDSRMCGYDVKINEQNKGKFYFKNNPGKRPDWFRLFGNNGENIEGFVPKELSTKNISAVLLLKVNNRFFALTFGYGRTLLKSNSFEEQFGLKVCMNAMDTTDFRVVERKNFDTMLTQSRTQMNQKCSIDEFALDVYNILLKAVSGEAKDKQFAKKITGSDSLAINCDITLQKLPEKCQKILDFYVSDSFKEKFPWMENLKEVVSKKKIDKLNEGVLNLIHDRNVEKIFLAVPEIIEWSAYNGFRFNEKDTDKVDILITDYYESRKKIESLSIAALKQHKIYVVESSTDQVMPRWSVFNCLNCEIEENDQRYVLTDGRWFSVAKTFVDETNQKIKDIEPYTGNFIEANFQEKENMYNKRLCKNLGDEYCCMDADNIGYGGGKSKIEFCDIYGSSSKELIHIKRYSGSAVLSHLFSQGYNSAKLLLSDPEFRKKVNTKLSPNFQLPNQDINAREYSIIFGIISKEANKVPVNLPFFSKLSLTRTVEELKDVMKFKVFVAGIKSQ